MWSLLLSKYTTKTVVAIEWSDAFLRIALLNKKGRDYTLLNADSEALTSACISHGKIIDFVQFCEILLILLKRNHIKNTYAGFVLNTSDTIIKKIATTASSIQRNYIMQFCSMWRNISHMTLMMLVGIMNV